MATAIESLLGAVLDDPNDLDCRLVYADALQERGDPRGEFIVHHIAGRDAAKALLKKHGKEWTSFLQPAVSRSGLRFVNGFIERVTFKVKHLDMLPGILDREPIREMRFRELGSEAPRLAALPSCTSRMTWLDLKHGQVSGKWFAALMEGRWDRLWRMWAPSNGIGDIGVRALIDASPPCLTSLNLYGTRLSDVTLARLAAWRGLARIEELNLRSNDLSDNAIAALLCAAPSLRWIGLPAAGPATLKVLAGPLAQTVQSLAVAGPEAARRALRPLYGRRLVRNPDYGDTFDVDWP